jgi:glycerophosphoryl diester phosphodiesterase
VTIQSFDWGALMRRCQLEPQLPIVALTNGTLLQAGQPGASPWLGGIDIKRLRRQPHAGSPVPPARRPQGSSVIDPGYQPFTTKEMVNAAHTAGMKVISWTVGVLRRAAGQ